MLFRVPFQVLATNPAIAVLCDAYSKGIRSYDVEKAYRYALNTSRLFGNNEEGYTPGSISHTLEYAYSDWCMARLSEWLGKEADKDRFEARARSYSSIYDTDSGWFRPRNKTGEFQPLPKAGRLTEGYGCTESNAYQQGWFVPHNVEGMVQMMGGRKKVLADLTDMFERTPKNYFWNQYYNHANEPVHHVPFLFNRLGAPELTQKWTRDICRNAYKNAVLGLVGNEDVGQMSAWYVLASSGIQPVRSLKRWSFVSTWLMPKENLSSLKPIIIVRKTYTYKVPNLMGSLMISRI